MTSLKEVCITREASLRDALQRLEMTGAGMLLLVDYEGVFERTVTDGDIRRLLLCGRTIDDSLCSLPKLQSVVLSEGFTRKGALELMNERGINHLPVLDAHKRVVRLLQRKELSDHILLSTPHLGTFEREFVEEAFRSNWIAPLGPNVDAFERELASLVGVAHAAALSSGTAAIHLALVLLEVGPGDIVFCSALTFAASANPIAYQGAQPVFVDSEPNSWNISPAALDAALTDARANGKLPRAVIAVNLYGQSADMDPIVEICRRFGVPIIEDAAESLGARYKGRPSGSFGALGVFSFNGNKIITTSGGGMLVGEDACLLARARFLATQAREPALHYEHRVIGFNYRMSNILAGVGRGQLRVLDDRVNARRAVFDRYRSELKRHEGISWMPEPEWSRATRWLSVCLLNPSMIRMSVVEIIHALAAEHIEARPVWKPMQMQPVFSDCKYFAHEGRSFSQQLFEQGLCLPSGSNMTNSQQGRVIDVLNSILGEPQRYRRVAGA